MLSVVFCIVVSSISYTAAQSVSEITCPDGEALINITSLATPNKGRKWEIGCEQLLGNTEGVEIDCFYWNPLACDRTIEGCPVNSYLSGFAIAETGGPAQVIEPYCCENSNIGVGECGEQVLANFKHADFKVKPQQAIGDVFGTLSCQVLRETESDKVLDVQYWFGTCETVVQNPVTEAPPECPACESDSDCSEEGECDEIGCCGCKEGFGYIPHPDDPYSLGNCLVLDPQGSKELQ